MSNFDAALVSAFSAVTGEAVPEGTALFAGDGSVVMQSIHDDSCRHGAECGGKSLFSAEQVAEFMTPETLKAVQHVHDHAAKNGASCDLYATRRSVYYSAPADFAINNPWPVNTLSAPADTRKRPATAGGDKPMPTLIEKFTALFHKAGVSDEDIAAHLKDADFAGQPAVLSDADKAVFAEQAAKIARLESEGVEKDAKAFATDLKRRKLILPSEESGVVAEFMQAAQDDAALPVTVNFTQGDKTVEGTRVDALKARHAARQPHDLLRELVETDLPGTVRAVFNIAETAEAGRPGAPTKETLDALKARTALGRKAIKA